MKRTRRRHHRSRTVTGEGIGLALIAIGLWLFVSGIVSWFAATRSPDDTAGAPSVREIQVASQLTADPLLGPSFSTWWNAEGEPTAGVATKYSAPTPRPLPSLLPATVAARRAAQVVNELAADAGESRVIPILFYHQPPPDFEQQLIYLAQRGYTVIDMDEALLGLAGNPLPIRPVVITLDDGFASQMDGFEILKRYNMKATYYIINGSAASSWCIGVNRRYRDPLQPPEGCGDAYLTWDQVRTLDKSGLITIAGHTIDHPNLTTLTPDQQYHEIADGKAEIERQVGHSIEHFCYPYGAYNATSMAAVQRAGYLTATTVTAGTNQSYSGRYEMPRLRTAYQLP